MTLPDERYRAISETGKLLNTVASSVGVPARNEWLNTAETARGLHRHYPTQFDLDIMARHAPLLVAKEMDPLYELCAMHETTANLANGIGLGLPAYQNTSPTDRYQAIKDTRTWLMNFTARTYFRGAREWKALVHQAWDLRDHFPIDYELDLIALAAPDCVAKTMDPLHRMCRVYIEAAENDVTLLAGVGIIGEINGGTNDIT